MSIRDLFAGDLVLLGKAKASKNAASTTSFDFGTPDDINLATAAPHNSRLLVVFTATTSGTTNTISFGVQDAPDSSGSIGTPAAAITDGTLTGGTGDQYAYTTVQVQAGRPWIRCQLTGNGTTDTFACTCMVFALKAGA